MAWVMAEEMVPMVELLVRRYGTVRNAGLALDQRFGLRPHSSERGMHRILSRHVQHVCFNTADRLETMERT